MRLDLCVSVCLYSLAPRPSSACFLFAQLFDTRVWCDAALRPMLASRAIGSGIKIEVVGVDDDPVVQTLRQFFVHIGHHYNPDKVQWLSLVWSCVADCRGFGF